MKKALLKRADLVVIGAVLLSALLLAAPRLWRETAHTATVRCRGEILDTVVLGEGEERVYTLPEGEVRVSFSAVGVSVVSSPCAGQDCVRTGTVGTAGDGVFCLPLGFSVTLSGQSDMDAVTG